MRQFDREEVIQVRNILQAIGLDAKEADVYLALLTAKSSAVSSLIKTIDFPRTTVYFILDRLREKGLVSFVEKGKIRHFIAEPPERLIAHAQDEQKRFVQLEQQLQDALPMLHSLLKPSLSTPSVKLLHGLKGLKDVYKEVLPHELMGILNPDVMYEAFGMTATELVFDKKFALQGRDLITQSKHTQDFIKNFKTTSKYDYRLLPEYIQFYCDVVVWKNNVAIFTHDPQHTIIQIESDRISQMIRAWFEAMWSISTPGN